ncbi:hypothetical protein OSB04_007826 [Centaurea solstitialis]|uniref:Uncharacterized protein n=1 Tax=Centaurea solstitialis TaxID=347529 RepID=A0AA38TYE1_9ASTR|nr:hypothetical protein OSB04_007826 [Centaurea solstitialis]
MAAQTHPLIAKGIDIHRTVSRINDELHSFRSWLRWMCVDQSTALTFCISWLVFVVFAIVIPLLSHFYLACSDCDNRHARPYDTLVQLSLTSIATLSFVCLSRFIRYYGLRRFLFFDKLCNESETVRRGYTQQVNLVSVSLLAGLMILLRSATRITHKAQGVTCLATKWHVCATIESFDPPDADTETPLVHGTGNQAFGGDGSSSDNEDIGSEEDDLDNTKLIPAYAYSTISFQKRQALVTYFENNSAGITVYGFMLDRTSIHTIVMIEMSLVLWLLGKTVGIS